MCPLFIIILQIRKLRSGRLSDFYKIPELIIGKGWFQVQISIIRFSIKLKIDLRQGILLPNRLLFCKTKPYVCVDDQVI